MKKLHLFFCVLIFVSLICFLLAMIGFKIADRESVNFWKAIGNFSSLTLFLSAFGAAMTVDEKGK